MTYLKYLILFTYLVTGGAISSQVNQHFYHVDIKNRVVEGSVAPEGSIPYMVALRTGILIRVFVCGGSIITKRHVLTAAHCIDSVYGVNGLYRTLRVVVGTNRWNFGGLYYSVKQNITHENWHLLTVKNDIGILVTRSNMLLTGRVKPVPLSFDYIGGDINSKVAGWGKILMTGGPISNRLLELNVRTVDGEECSNTIDSHLDPSEQNIKYNQTVELCGFIARGKGVCNGDSGSALVRMDTTQQIGVVSWGYLCAQGVPDVFVRLSFYKDWVERALSRCHDI